MRTRVRVSRGLGILLAGAILMGGIGMARRGLTVEAVGASLVPWAVMLAAAVAHELGHLAAAWGVGVRMRGISLDILGARMELDGGLSYGGEFFVAAAGPFASLVLAAVTYPFSSAETSRVGMFCGTSLLLGGVNLLPVGTLDGGRMLRCAVAVLWGDRAATGALRGTTAFFLGLLWLTSVYGLLRGGELLSVFAFSLCLLGRTVCDGD